MRAAPRAANVISVTKEDRMGTNTALTIVAIVLVVAVLGAAAWALVIAPLVVPWRHRGHT